MTGSSSKKSSKKRKHNSHHHHHHEKESTDPEGVKYSTNEKKRNQSVVFNSSESAVDNNGNGNGNGLRKRAVVLPSTTIQEDSEGFDTVDDDIESDETYGEKNGTGEEGDDPDHHQRGRFLRSSISKMWTKLHHNGGPPVEYGRVETSLFTDTFSFLMTAKYPCCDKQPTKKQLQQQQQQHKVSVGTIGAYFDASGGRAEQGGGGNIGEQPQQQQSQVLMQQSQDSQRRASVSTGDNRTCTFSALFGHPGCQVSNSSSKVKESNPLPSAPQQQEAAAIISSTSTTDKPTTTTPTSELSEIFASQHHSHNSECTNKNILKLKNVNADAWYSPFVIGWLVVILQVFIYIVVLLNTIQQGQPPNADTLLRLAQAFALMVALYTQSDLVDAVFMLSEGSKPFDEISTPFKFTTSNVMRLVAGNLGIVASFVLVVYAPDVIDLLLNFTAIEFVATLDNSCFELASKGFLGISIEKKAKQVECFKYEYKIRRKSIFVRFFVYSFYFLLYTGAFFAIVGLQATRQIGVDNEVYVQFDDSKVPILFGISGAYIGCTGFLTRNRGRIRGNYARDASVSDLSKYTGNIAYVEASWTKDNCPQLKVDENSGYEIFPANSFIYCYTLDGWVFIKQETTQPCNESVYVVKSFNIDSKPSDSFDILSHSNADWFVRRPDTRGEILLDNVFVKPAHLPQYSISYNCTDGIELSGDYSAYGALGIFRFFGVPLPRSYYEIFKHDESEEESPSFFEEFSLVYRQVFIGNYVPSAIVEEDGTDFINLTEFRNADFIQTVSVSCEDPVPEWFLIFYDGLRWHVMDYFNLDMFLDYARRKHEDIRKEPDSACAWKIFLKSYLRDKSWLLNETIAQPMIISSPVRFLSPDDSGGPSRELDWFRSDLVYSQGLVRAGITSEEQGWNVESSCVIRSAVCNENEKLLNLDITTGRFADETAVLMQRNPSFEIQCQSTSECRSLEEYYSRLEGTGEFYDNVEVVPVSKPGSVFSISEGQVKDVRFKDRETRYQIESCVPTEVGSTYCIDVRFLNMNRFALPQYDLSFSANMLRNRDDNERANCRLYHVCHFELTPGTFVPRVLGPNNCTLSDIEAVYPAIKSQTPF